MEQHFLSRMYGLAMMTVVSTSTKGQLISKGLFKFSFAPKNEQIYFCISALASKKRSNQKNTGTIFRLLSIYFTKSH